MYKPLTFQPDQWPEDKSAEGSNCYAYALDEKDYHWAVPGYGFFSGVTFLEYEKKFDDNFTMLIVDRVARIIYFSCLSCTAFLTPPAAIIFTVPVKVIVILSFYRKEQSQERIPFAFGWLATYPL